MKKIILSVATALSLMTSLAAQESKSYNKGINIIPMPKELTTQQGEFVLSPKTTLVASGKEAMTIAKFFQAKMQASTGLPLVVKSSGASQSIKLSINPKLKGLGKEGYTLVSSPKGVEVVGVSAEGLFWGMQSLMQLLPAEIEAKTKVKDIRWVIPAVSIKDEPAFPYRGMHLDPSRQFATVDEVKRHIDVISLFKINKLHWHLTEDQGWRIEIKKYPRLTSVGSVRKPSSMAATNGFYTQEQVKDIVAYAKARHVDVIPEIEMPGHAMGAIVAYPELACNPKTQKGSDYQVRELWGVEQDVLCAGNDKVFAFLQDVIDEVAPLFPSEYFHIGGDECPKIRWKKCPKCQARIKAEGLKDEHELQSYVIRRAEKMLAKHGKKLVGWDEILEGGLAPTATVMSWRGEQGGIQSANEGHDVIMTPGSGGLYIDHYQGDPKIEPVAICCYAPLAKTYAYYPIPESISADKRHHILGAQANVWSEYMYTDSIRQYRAYPRTIALAEAVWTPREKKNFNDFNRRLDNAYVRMDQYQVNYHIPQPEQPNGSCNFVAFTDTTSLVLKTTRPIKVVYTTDGSEPTPNSPVYTQPIKVNQNVVIKTASVLPSGKMSPIRHITFEKQTLRPATELKDAKEGLRVKISVGDYDEVKDFKYAQNWENAVVPKIESIIPDKLSNNMDELQRKAVIAEGYIEVPQDGVYFFSTNYDEFWIDGDKLIDNNGEVKKFSRRDKSIALKAGYHPVKIIFVGAVLGGFPSYWDEGHVQMRLSSSPEWKNAKAFYK